VPHTSTVLSTVTDTTTRIVGTVTATGTVTQTVPTTTTQTTTVFYSVTGVSEPAVPPIPGFPLESILAGLGLGLLGLHLVYRNRKTRGRRAD
jgi:hypothetical protein